jgi:hypothetical protein
MYYHLPSTGLRTTSADWNKYYHLPSTGLCTTTAEWNKYYHLPSTGLCTTSNGWKLPLDYILIIVSVHVLWRGKHSDHTTPWCIDDQTLMDPNCLLWGDQRAKRTWMT